MHQVNKLLPLWQNEFQRAYRSVESLFEAGFLKTEEIFPLKKVADRYAIFLTPYYASLIDKNDPRCPIRLQAIPSLEEWEESNELQPDPLSDLKHQPAPKITHRYKNRALLHLTTNCSMYCRYCFRKSLLNDLKEPFVEGDLEKSFQYLSENAEIEEVIFSGGDPLLVSDGNLLSALLRVSAISHVKRIRIHTRIPVTCPMRITEELVEKLSGVSKPLVFVLHFNHPKEITGEAISSIKKIKTFSAQILNQSVLLKNVNDNPLTLKTLSEKLFEAGVLPYYLHHPDPARGTKHFQFPKEKGIQIYNTLKESLSGYLVPRYVEDNLNFPYKFPIQ